MRKQIAAANWKMNLTVDKAEVLQNILSAELTLNEAHLAVFAVPAPYRNWAQKAVAGKIFLSLPKTVIVKNPALTPVKFLLKCCNH